MRRPGMRIGELFGRRLAAEANVMLPFISSHSNMRKRQAESGELFAGNDPQLFTINPVSAYAFMCRRDRNPAHP